MNELSAEYTQCPFCGERIEVPVNLSEPEKHYINDCQICCRPIDFHVFVDRKGAAYISTGIGKD